MRTFQNNALAIEYPDTLVMAFDAVPINLTALNASENPRYTITATITDTDANRTLTDSRTAHEGKVAFDLSGYVRALMAPYMIKPFKADADGYLPMTHDFAVVLEWAGATVLSFAISAVWGSLPIGSTFNPSRSVKIWQGKPNITALFGRGGSKVNGSVVFSGTKFLPIPSTAEYLTLFCDGILNPWNYVQRNTYNTAITSLYRAIMLECAEYTTVPATFAADGNNLTLNAEGGGFTEMRFKVTADNMRIKSWRANVRGNQAIRYTIHTSNGDTYEVNGTSDLVAIEVSGLLAKEDAFTIYATMPADPEAYALTFDMLQVTIEDIGTGQVTEQTINIADDMQFLTYQRTGTMTLQGTGREVQVKTVMQCGTEGVFLRWIDGQGFPVSWLFQKGSEQRKVTASSAYRANMEDGLYANNGNGQQLQVDTKDAKVTQELAASLVTADEYDTLRSILTSPVVEMWDGEQWQRVNVTAGTDKRTSAVKQQFEFSIIMPEEVAQQL